MHTPGIEGQCPRCLAPLIETTWRGLINMTDPGASGAVKEQVFKCVMCGHWEDAVIRANRLAQHVAVGEQVMA